MEEHQVHDTSMQLSQDSQESNHVDSATPRRSVEEVLEELDWVEAEQRKCQQLGDDDAAMELKRKEIADELWKAYPSLTDDELNLKVEEELNIWNEQLAKHDKRVRAEKRFLLLDAATHLPSFSDLFSCFPRLEI